MNELLISELKDKGYNLSQLNDMLIITDVKAKDKIYIKSLIYVLCYELIHIHEYGNKFEFLLKAI
jgi:hypothetical protein